MECICPILERPTIVDQTDFCSDPWSVVRCSETGFVFLSNPPDYSQLETEFAWEKSAATERNRRQQAQPWISRLSTLAKRAKALIAPKRNKIAALTLAATQNKNPAEPIQLLDVGCGAGDLMVELHRRFSQAGRKIALFGIEVSKQLALHSEEKVSPLGGKVVSASAVEGTADLETSSIDVAVMSSFLEHESRPLNLLKRLHPILRANGAVVLKVPNFSCWNRIFRGRKWCGFRYPDHVNYFTPQTLQRLAEEAGYTVARQNLKDKFPLSDNMYAVLKKCA